MHRVKVQLVVTELLKKRPMAGNLENPMIPKKGCRYFQYLWLEEGSNIGVERCPFDNWMGQRCMNSPHSYRRRLAESEC